MAILGLNDSFQSNILFERNQQMLYEMLIKMKFYYEKNTSAIDTARALFFGDNRTYWNLIKEMKNYKINAHELGGGVALKFVQNVFGVFDSISSSRNINLNDLIVGMKFIYKKQLKNAETDDIYSSEFAGIFD